MREENPPTFDEILEWAFQAGLDVSLYQNHHHKHKTVTAVFAHGLYERKSMQLVEQDWHSLRCVIVHLHKKIFEELRCPPFKRERNDELLGRQNAVAGSASRG